MLPPPHPRRPETATASRSSAPPVAKRPWRSAPFAGRHRVSSSRAAPGRLHVSATAVHVVFSSGSLQQFLQFLLCVVQARFHGSNAHACDLGNFSERKLLEEMQKHD